ncbi:hypothetical protein TNCV_3034681 [Trichonephila clavipes]|nr:hypothetical protein TNCV_3034681 [Trichonephila clavipes]
MYLGVQHGSSSREANELILWDDKKEEKKFFGRSRNYFQTAKGNTSTARMHKWRGHRMRGERKNREKEEGSQQYGGRQQHGESQQHGGAREHGKMSGIVITLARIETKWC